MSGARAGAAATAAPFWLSAFLDFPQQVFTRGVEFWRGVTGADLSQVRGEQHQFATLVPAGGDDYLRVQRLDLTAPRVHVDVHVAGPRVAADAAVAAGATELADLGYVIARSPAGITFCLVDHPAQQRPPAVTWDDGQRSRVNQLCLDVPGERLAEETAFWATLLDARPERFCDRDEFRALIVPPTWALQVIVQRLEASHGAGAAHLDVDTDHREPEVARHRALGAEVLAIEDDWTVMRDPVGGVYCITDGDPDLPRTGSATVTP